MLTQESESDDFWLRVEDMEDKQNGDCEGFAEGEEE